MKSKLFMDYIPSYTLLLMMLAGWAIPVVAQEDYTDEEQGTASQSFSLVYVAQDNDMPVPEIERKLDLAWNRAVLNGPTVFYLSRGLDDPIIMEVDMVNEDVRKNFEETIIAAVNQNVSYTADGRRDKQRLLDILQDHPVLSEDGTPLYKETNFDFHVGKDFWETGNNETVIAALFFELNIIKYIPDEFHFNVFCPRSVTYNEEMGPFGALNPDDCRRNINLERSY